MTTASQPRSDVPEIVTVNVDVDVGPTGSSSTQAATTSGNDAPGWDTERAPVYIIEFTSKDIINKRRQPNSPGELRENLKQRKAAKSRRLVIIHGLPVDYIEILRDELSLEAEFVESIARSRVYRPWKLQNKGVRVASFDYPELVKREDLYLGTTYKDEKKPWKPGDELPPLDLMPESPVHDISNSGDKVSFCRVSLWLTENIYVMFLDAPVWKNPMSLLQKARYPFAVTTPRNRDHHEQGWGMIAMMSGREIPSLEKRLHDGLSTRVPSIPNLLELLSDIVYDQWVELLEELGPSPQNPDDPSVYRQLLRSLERNLDSNSSCHRHIGLIESFPPDWKLLLDRAERTMRLAVQLNPPITKLDMPVQDLRPSRHYAVDKPESSEPKENQRALDRVTYLGGILLPMSIVTGILSMGDTFGPGGSMFYVFWAVAVPLTIITLFIVYADKIRRTEVWILEQSSNADSAEAAGNKPTRLGKSTPQLESAISYSYTESLPVNGRIATAQVGVAKRGRWKKEQLGWIRACKTILHLESLQKA